MGKVTMEIHDVKEMSWAEIKARLWLGEEEAQLIDGAGLGDAFLALAWQWRYEEGLPNHGSGYFTVADIDEWLAYDWHDIAPALGLESGED